MEDNLWNSGIYAIVNNLNNKLYIGSSSNLYRRKCNHFSRLNKKTHHCIPLQNAWNKYGEHNFSFCVLVYLEPEMLLYVEQKILDIYFLNKTKILYNIAKFVEGRSFFGRKHTEDTRRKMREHHADFNGAKNPFYGKKHSKESIMKAVNNRDLSGEANGNSKLNWRIALNIRKLYKLCGFRKKELVIELAKKYNVSISTIYSIGRGHTWK